MRKLRACLKKKKGKRQEGGRGELDTGREVEKQRECENEGGGEGNVLYT